MFAGRGGETPRLLQRALRTLMTEHADVVRSEVGLKAGLDKLSELEVRATNLGVHPDIAGFNDLAHAFDLYGSLLAARATLECALERRETRGCHNRSDFTEQDDSLRGSFVWSPESGVAFEQVAKAPESFRSLAYETIDASVVGKLVE